MAAVDEIEKCRKRNKVLKEKLSKYQEETNQIIMDFKNQLQEAKKTKEDLVVLLKERIQYSEKLEKDIIQLRKAVDEKYIKSKFEKNSRILDDILSRQRPSNDKTDLGYDKSKEARIFLCHKPRWK